MMIFARFVFHFSVFPLFFSPLDTRDFGSSSLTLSLSLSNDDKVGNEIGGIIAQDAETIRFVKANGQLVSVTHLKKGDSVLAFSKEASGRHFGMEVADEYILEK